MSGDVLEPDVLRVLSGVIKSSYDWQLLAFSHDDFQHLGSRLNIFEKWQQKNPQNTQNRK